MCYRGIIQMGLFDFLKERRNKPKGLLAYLELDEWFLSLTSEERAKVRKYYSTGFNTDPKHLDSGDTSFCSITQQGFLGDIGHNALAQKDYAFAETILLKALQSRDDNVIDRHFVYNSLIELYYKQRESSPDAIEKCIKYCLEDIGILEEFIGAWKKKYSGDIPRIPSVERLAIIYEKQGKFEEAINICEMALRLGLRDSTKGGFEGRKARLQKKLSRL